MNPAELTVMVTGATSGFGHAIAQRFLKAGSRVIGTGRRRERLEALSAQWPADRFCPLVLDVRDKGAIDLQINGLSEDFQDVDVLVNNAGLALGLEPAHEADLEQWETMIETNILGLVYCTRLLLPGMVARGRGHVVNIGSVAGSYPYPGGNAYGATKAFVSQFSLNLRADLVNKNVRVTSLEPGLAETEFSVVRFSGDSEKAGAVYAGKRPMTAEDIAEAVFWVVSLPDHVNINRLEMMPTTQAFGPFSFHSPD